jgi:acetolactate synthase-1/2/3 large subunit
MDQEQELTQDNGAYSLIRTLVASGVDVCFANPGTSEMHFVAALERVPAMRAVLSLAEGSVTGAADGYGRMALKPAATLLHLGPGLANGLSNLHNARRAATPIVNIVGDHATHHHQYDAPLTSDIVGFARTVSAWIHTSRSADTVGSDAARAVRAARDAPGKIATLIVPADTAWNPTTGVATMLPPLLPAPVSEEAISQAAAKLRDGKRTVLLLRGAALLEEGLTAAGRIAAASNCRLCADTFAPRTARGAGRVNVERIPYFAETIVEFLKGMERIILVGSKPPVAFFAYPGKPSWLVPPGCELFYLAHEHEDAVAALKAVAEAIDAPNIPIYVSPLTLPDLSTAKLNAFTIGQAIAHFMPEEAIIADDSATSGGAILQATITARPHDHLALTGGAIGIGLPMAIGAAIACPGRKVLALEGDGSAMYTPQALWTMARENLDVTTVIFNNHAYKILKVELARLGAGDGGQPATQLTDLRRPEIDWIALGKSLGVESSRAETFEQFIAQFKSAMFQRGPRLIEAIL